MYFLAKLVRSGLHAEQAKTYLRKLKAIDVYPLASPSSYQYSSLKKIAVAVLNREYFLLPVLELTTFQYNLRHSA